MLLCQNNIMDSHKNLILFHFLMMAALLPIRFMIVSSSTTFVLNTISFQDTCTDLALGIHGNGRKEVNTRFIWERFGI